MTVALSPFMRTVFQITFYVVVSLILSKILRSLWSMSRALIRKVRTSVTTKKK